MTITRDHTATIKAIRNCIGKTVSGVTRVQYYFNDQEDEDGLGDLEITFSDNFYLTLMGLGDAESIQADNNNAIIYETFNVTENDVASWKRLDLTSEQDWKKLIGQKLKTAEVEWNLHQDNDNRIVACILHFDSDFVTFYETGSDANKFYVNETLSVVDRQTKIEIIKNVC